MKAQKRKKRNKSLKSLCSDKDQDYFEMMTAREHASAKINENLKQYRVSYA